MPAIASPAVVVVVRAMAPDKLRETHHTCVGAVVVVARIVVISADQLGDGVAKPVPPPVKRPPLSPPACGLAYVVVAKPACTPVTVEPSLALPRLSCRTKQAKPLAVTVTRLARLEV